MQMENWTYPATDIKTIEGEEESPYSIQAYRDRRKCELAVGAGVLIFFDNNIIKRMQYRHNGRCSKSQSEKMAIQKALEYIKSMESNEKE